MINGHTKATVGLHRLSKTAHGFFSHQGYYVVSLSLYLSRVDIYIKLLTTTEMDEGRKKAELPRLAKGM